MSRFVQRARSRLWVPRAGASAPPSGGSAVHFASQWQAATGPDDNAISDGGNWPALGGTEGGGATIVAGEASLTGRGNYFRGFNAGQEDRVCRHDTMVPHNTTHWGRCYFRDQRTAQRMGHIIALGSIGSVPIQMVALGLRGAAGGTSVLAAMGLDTTGANVSGNDVRFETGTPDVGGIELLDHDQWYLQEWELRYLSASRVHLFLWTHQVNAAGIITAENLFTEATYFAQDHGATSDDSLAQRQIDEATYWGMSQRAGETGGVPHAESDRRRYVVGQEGPLNGSTNGEHFELASFAISLEGRLRDQAVL